PPPTSSLSLHDALPISLRRLPAGDRRVRPRPRASPRGLLVGGDHRRHRRDRSGEPSRLHLLARHVAHVVDTLGFLAHGFAQALTPQNLMFAFIGSVLGTLVGVLPGIGPTSGIAILLPLTCFLPPAPAIIMLAAIYYGAMYGGSTTAILVKIGRASCRERV